MKKKLLVFILTLFYGVNVYAIDAYTPVSSSTTFDSCVNFQTKEFTTSGYGYYGQCMKAVCTSGSWEKGAYLTYDIVTCSNGNKDMYKIVTNSGCDQYKNSCYPNNIYKYCTSVYYYDCSRTSDGKTYIAPSATTTTTTTTTKRPTTTTTKKPTTTTTITTTTTTTTTTAPVKDNNNYLSSIKLSEGTIIFEKDNLNYEIDVQKDVTYIEVEAKTESDKSKIEIKNNDNISEDNPIEIIVTAENGEKRTYTINIAFVNGVSSNLIESMIIDGYKLDFSPEKNSYNLKIDRDVKSLEFDITLEDIDAEYEIIGNSNLKNGSKINIVVTGSDNKDNIYTITISKSKNIAVILIVIIVIGIGGVVAYKFIRNLKSDNDNKGVGEYDYE